VLDKLNKLFMASFETGTDSLPGESIWGGQNPGEAFEISLVLRVS